MRYDLISLCAILFRNLPFESHAGNVYFRLQCLSFDVGVETGGTQPMASVEVCACPEGYAGTSCEVNLRSMCCTVDYIYVGGAG